MKKFLPQKRIPALPLLITLFLAMPLLTINSQGLLDPVAQEKFVNPLPIPAQIDVTNGGTVDMYMEQTVQWLGLGTALSPLQTVVWGYGPTGAVTYPGPTFIAKKNVPVNVNWFNNLPEHFLPVDVSLHMAHPAYMHHDYAAIRDWYAAGNTPTVPHLHGGHTESASDGLPEAWYTNNALGPPLETGAHFTKTNYVYHNTQEAATLWYHDHALGITRLNVNAGLAGFYLLEDSHERQLVKDGILPKGKHDIEIVIQDRKFLADGELYWPAFPGDPAYADFITGEGVDLSQWPDVFPGEGPTALAEFFGDFIVVNGMVWPFLDVEPRPYRFRLLNGSDSRFYILKFENDMSFLQVASDDGLLPFAVELDELVIAPGERAEVVIDFRKVTGPNLSVKLLNFGPDAPFGGLPVDPFDVANPLTTGQIMQFNVNKKLKAPKGVPLATVTAGTALGNVVPLPASTVTRQLGLFEGSDIYGRLNPLLGALNDNTGDIEPLIWDDEITENPALNAVETWEVYNFTGDAHPVHLHLVAFQIVGRIPINDFGTSGFNPSEFGFGPPEPPADNETGWKDTFIVPPGYVGIVKAKFDLPGRYVWHCHILSHEDHEMMRPFHVGPMPVVAAGFKGATGDDNKTTGNRRIDNKSMQEDAMKLAGFALYPNPAADMVYVNFNLDQLSRVSLKLYGLDGRMIVSEKLGTMQSGSHSYNLSLDSQDEGLYILELNVGSKLYREKFFISR